MNDESPQSRTALSRRRLMQGAAAAGVAAWIPFQQIPAAQAALPAPPSFPGGIPLFQQSYNNWAGDIAVDGVWTCTPRTPADVVTLANWARGQGWRLRAKGSSHNWSPLSLAKNGSDSATVVLVDTKTSLTAISVDTATSRVRVQTGATMLALLTALEAKGLGVTAAPAPGDLTVGGVLAIDGHGTAVPRTGRDEAGRPHVRLDQQPRAGAHRRRVGQRDVAVRAAHVRAAGTRGRRAASRTSAGRSSPRSSSRSARTSGCAARAGSTSRPPRCSRRAGSGGRTFASYLTSAGRVEAIWFPFTRQPVAQGVERRAQQAAAVAPGERALQLRLQRQPAAVGRRPRRRRSSPATALTRRLRHAAATTSSRPAWSRRSPATSGAGRRTCCSTCDRRPCASPPTATRSSPGAPTCSG